MITLIDNYDSFTFNLFHELSKKDEVQIFKNDEIKKNFLKIIKSKAVVISPGPSNPFNSGDCLDLVNKIYSFMPILGVCLGHQILGVYFGIKIKVLKIVVSVSCFILLCDFTLTLTFLVFLSCLIGDRNHEIGIDSYHV